MQFIFYSISINTYSMTTNTISIQYDLSKEELSCNVCLEESTFRLLSAQMEIIL
jgi:hypothetical protein